MRILGLDPSTNTGYALVDSGRVVVSSGSLHFPKLKGWERVRELSFGVLRLVNDYKPDHILIEEMIVGRASSAITVIQIASFIRFTLWQEGIAHHDVHPATLKKFLTGSGNASKEQVMVHTTAKYNVLPKTNDEADAINAAMFGHCLMDPKGTPAEPLVVVKDHVKRVIKEGRALPVGCYFER